MTASTISMLLEEKQKVSSSAQEWQTLKAGIIFSLLTNQEVIFPAKDLVRSPAFRSLIYLEPQFVNHFSKSKVRILDLRSPNIEDDPTIKSDFRTLPEANRDHAIRLSAFAEDDPFKGDDAPFERIEQNVSRSVYDNVEIGTTFAINARQFFQSEGFARHYGEGVGAAFCSALEEIEEIKRASDYFSSIDFLPQIGKDVFFEMRNWRNYIQYPSIFDSFQVRECKISTEARKSIQDYISGLYAYNICNIVGAYPICDTEQSRQIGLLANEKDLYAEEYPIKRKYYQRYNPADYVYGLNSLRPESIDSLREKDAFKALCEAKETPHTSPNDRKHLSDCILEYASYVDEEILRVTGYLGEIRTRVDAGICFSNRLRRSLGEIEWVGTDVLLNFGISTVGGTLVGTNSGPISGLATATAATVTMHVLKIGAGTIGDNRDRLANESARQAAIQNFKTERQRKGENKTLHSELIMSQHNMIPTRIQLGGDAV